MLVPSTLDQVLNWQFPALSAEDAKIVNDTENADQQVLYMNRVDLHRVQVPSCPSI